MKKKYFVLAAVITTLCMKVFSQEKKSKLSVNPFQLGLSNVLNIEYERSFRDGNIGVAFYYGNRGPVAVELWDDKTGISEQSITIKKYVNSFSSNSWWYGGQLSIASNRIGNLDLLSSNTRIFGASFKGGYQFVVKSFYLGFHVGLGYALTNKFSGTIYSYSTDVSGTQILIPYGIKMGINF